MKLRIPCVVFAIVWMAILCLGPRVDGQEAQSNPPGEVSSPAVSAEGVPTSLSTPEPLTLEQRADLFMVRKSFGDALEYYQRALRDQKYKNARIWNKSGIAWQNLEEFGAARRAYKKAIKLKKDFAEPYNNLGTTYYLAKKPKKSLKWYKKAIVLDPSSASFHYNYGVALYESKKFELAVRSFQEALRLDPDFFQRRSGFGTTVEGRASGPKYFFYMAKVFASLDRPAEAVRYLRRALEDGYQDFDRIDRDPDLQKLADYPEYVELRQHPPKPL